MSYSDFVSIIAQLGAIGLEFKLKENLTPSNTLIAYRCGGFLPCRLRASRHFIEVADYLRILFGAVFFVSLSVLADLRKFTFNELVFMLALTATAILSKSISCALPALCLGKRPKETMLIGMSMVPRGKMAMVIALFALNDGLIQQPAYTSLILMSLLTMIAAPMMLKKFLYRDTT